MASWAIRESRSSRTSTARGARFRWAVGVSGALIVGLAGCGGTTQGGEAAGGTAAGGTAAGGTAAGGTSPGGAGGLPVPALCALPLEGGICNAYFEVWGYDPEVGECVPFVYGGCGGNANNFATRELCAASCAATTPLDACDDTTTCVLAPAGCCAACEPVGEGAYAAVAADRVAAYEAQKGCGDVDCAACIEVPPSERTSQYFRAACVEGRCVVRDVRTEPITACETAGECRLRCGAGCCPGCGEIGDGVIAVRADADASTAFCDGVPSACDDCACALPDQYAADCRAGRCVVTGLPVCTPGFDPSCNLTLEMASIAGTCNPDGTCTCAAGRTQDPATGRCF